VGTGQTERLRFPEGNLPSDYSCLVKVEKLIEFCKVGGTGVAGGEGGKESGRGWPDCEGKVTRSGSKGERPKMKGRYLFSKQRERSDVSRTNGRCSKRGESVETPPDVPRI